MNKSLVALTTKLSWQLNDLSQSLKTSEEKLKILKENLADLQNKIQEAATIPATINPEKEIARLNFMMQKQQEFDTLVCEIKEIEAHSNQLIQRQARLNSELKMLEKYQEKKLNIEKEKALKLEEKNANEWNCRSYFHESD